MDPVTLGLSVAAGLVLIVFIAVYNGIISRKNRAERAWADVIAYERNKLKVLPKLEEQLSQYTGYEKGLLKEVTALRASAGALDPKTIDTTQLAQVERQSQSVMKGVNIMVEAYPDLKASNLVQGFMKEVSEQQANITAAIAVFNQTVEAFNNGIQTFPNALVNALANHQKALNTFSDAEAAAQYEYKPNF